MILVTGAGGTVGREVVRELQDSNAGFKAGYHSVDKAKRAEEQGIEGVLIDYERPETLQQALSGVDRLFLLSGAHPDQAKLEIRAVTAAKDAGVQHVVKLSVWAADGEGFSFARMHRAVEKEIEKSGMTWTFLRPNSFMQNVVNYMGETIRSQGAIYESIGESKVSHVDVRDIAAVAVKALTEPGHEEKAYELSGPEALTYGQVADKLTSATGKSVVYIPVSDEDYRGGLLGAGIPPDYADALIDLQRFLRGDSSGRLTSAVRDVTGRDAISFDEFARDYSAALRGETGAGTDAR